MIKVLGFTLKNFISPTVSLQSSRKHRGGTSILCNATKHVLTLFSLCHHQRMPPNAKDVHVLLILQTKINITKANSLDISKVGEIYYGNYQAFLFPVYGTHSGVYL